MWPLTPHPPTNPQLISGMVGHTGLSLEPPDFPVVPKAGAAGNVEPVTRQPSFAHSVVTVATELCSPPLPPKGHRAKWITHSLPFRSHKPQTQLLSWPPFSQRRKPRLTRGCQSCKAKPSPESTSAHHPRLRLPSRNVAPVLYKCCHVHRMFAREVVFKGHFVLPSYFPG